MTFGIWALFRHIGSRFRGEVPNERQEEDTAVIPAGIPI